MKRRTLSVLVVSFTLAGLVPGPRALRAAEAGDFRSAWPKGVTRIWAGPEYWANRLQDWRVADGRLECATSGGDRNVHLLTRQLGEAQGDLRMSVRLGAIEPDQARRSAGWAGFRIGAIGYWKDYRDSARRGQGLDAGLTTDGKLFVGRAPGAAAGAKAKKPKARAKQAQPAGADALPIDGVELRVTAEPAGDGYRLTLAAHDAKDGRKLAELSRSVAADRMVGNLALVCHFSGGDGRGAQAAGGNVRFWFRDWRVAGGKVEAHDERAFGPVLWAQYTLSGGVLKMTAQMPPLGEKDATEARLEVQRQPGGPWAQIAIAKIHPLARTASFRVEKWDATRDTPYRVAYALIGADGKASDHHFRGTIRRDPVDKDTIVVAAFTGNSDYAFPNLDLVRHVKAHDPDVLFFSGDNIYENVGGYGIVRSPLEAACLDYLRKWYFFGWAYADLLRDRPCVSIPDDHDVYQGNLWGHGGRKAPGGVNSGGYTMDPNWVKVVERTQTSNLPDPFDPTPVEQGIGVYYTSMTYGRVSFAILEDRKFKTGPEGLVPPTGGRSDHVSDPNFDPKTADVPGARLLGERQLAFLRAWAADWRGADFKCALSQTVFANVATLHGAGLIRLIADYDSNGWPQTGRNKALRELRRAFALMIGGDQHLATLVHHGVETWGDAGWSLCVPSVANFYPRAWVPLKPARNFRPGMIEHTGEFLDPFGNHVTVYAHTNPRKMGREPAAIHDKMPGYGIVRFHRKTRKITIECWPLFADPRDPRTGSQYDGWPRTIDQLDNYARPPAAWLPKIEVKGMADPVVQVIDEAAGEVVYTLRIRGATFQPWVFGAGSYTVHVGEQGTEQWETLQGLKAQQRRQDTKTLSVAF